MALFDLPLAELRTYRPERAEPEDFDVFFGHSIRCWEEGFENRPLA